MSFVPVDVFLKDTSPLKKPIPGVVLRVYGQDGKLIFTQAQTDVNGRASFLLPSPQSFQLRMYKFGHAFPNPKLMDVVEPPASNVFDIAVDVIAPPISPDPRLCTCFGYFRKPDGGPAEGVDLHFIPQYKPLLLDGAALLIERTIVRTDEQGYVQVNLVRNAKYAVTVQGMEDMQRLVDIPDAPNVNLPDLLFPVVSEVTFDPPGPYVLSVGQEMQLTPIVHTSDGNFGQTYDVYWGSENQSVLAVLLAGGIITIRGNTVGIGYITGVRADQTIVRIPDRPITGLPLPVVVQ